jgi:NitT/TauT family transport system substrate-binding protein
MSARLLLHLLLAGWVLLLAGCGEQAPPATPESTTSPALRVAIDRWPGYYPAVLADELGYFAQAGLSVEVVLPDNTDQMLAEFAGGGHDLVGVALGDLITLTRSRPDVQVLLVSDQSAGGDALLAAAGFDAGTAQLLRIGTNLGGFGELFVREVLPALGIDPQRVEWVNVDASEVPGALARGEIELGHCWEPYASEAERGGAQRIASSLDTPGLIPDVIATTQHLATTRSAELQAFRQAWFRAIDYWQAHPAAATERIASRLRLKVDEVNLTGIALQDEAANRRLLGDGHPVAELLPVIERYSAFFVTHGRLLEPVDRERMLWRPSRP